MNKIKVLIADGTASLRQFIKYALENRFPNIVIEMANSGKNIQQRMETSRYDLVFYEKEMPLLDGYSLLEWLRRHESLKATPLILMSPGTDGESLKKAIQLGADEYLVKPFTIDSLVGKVASVINRLNRRKHEKYRAEGKVILRSNAQTVSGNLLVISDDGLSGVIDRKAVLPQILEKVDAGIELVNNRKLDGIPGVIVRVEALEEIPDVRHIKFSVRFIKGLVPEKEKELEGLLSSLAPSSGYPLP